MLPIYLFNNKQKGNIGMNADDFEKEFKSICRNHRDEKRARVFAFILTDFHTMEANHFILNEVYWNTLHTLSGHYLTIFHFDFKSSDVNKLFRKGKIEVVKHQYDQFFVGLSRLFESDSFNEVKMPSILFFQTKNEDILDFFCVELDSKELQRDMNDLTDFIRSAVESVKNVTDDNLDNSTEIYNLVKSDVHATKSKKVWTARVKKIVKLYELIPF